jgi:ubiquinone/menaquinone biosynthesis C-methylase UbiE
VSDVWSERAQAYRESDAHREGADLDVLAAWAGEATGRRALDVATGGGHAARVLRDAGFEVVTLDPAPGMEPTVVASADHIPFADGSFDVVACRVAAHHFPDVGVAVSEMARVSAELVIVIDTLYQGEAGEEAEGLRDESHGRNRSEEEWRGYFGAAGLDVEAVEQLEHPISFSAWLARTGCTGAAAARVRELLAGRIEGDTLQMTRIAVMGRKR